ncbi:hypothetical protein BGX27_003004 [Mortierella sp. AM989]|nr:hypothetical protein BGX27_003004 [Mortierella sp. AM989]
MVRLTKKEEDKDVITPVDTIWYLAYGSNMDPNVLTEWRKIQPIESKKVVVPEYWLSFDFNGVPFMEPCFASVLKKDLSRIHDKNYAQFVHDRCCYGQEFVWNQDHPEKSYPPTLQGVAHKITLREWTLIIQSECGWGHYVPTSYKHIEVNCSGIDLNENIPAQILVARPTAIRTRCQPSLRYKNILVAGAAHHGLDPIYQDYLMKIIPYACTGLRSKVAKSVFFIFNIPIVIAFALLIRVNKGRPADQHVQPPFWMVWYFDKASRFSNTAHDFIVEAKLPKSPELAAKAIEIVAV